MSVVPLHRLSTYVDERDARRMPAVPESASGTFASESAMTSARSGPPDLRVTPRTSASGTASSAVPSAMEVPLPGASASDGCGLHSPQRLRSWAVARAAFAMLNVAAPPINPATVDGAPASMSASDATLNEAAETSTPAPSDMKAAMARCLRRVISPRIAPTNAPDPTADPQQKAHTAPIIPSVISCSFWCDSHNRQRSKYAYGAMYRRCALHCTPPNVRSAGRSAVTPALQPSRCESAVSSWAGRNGRGSRRDIFGDNPDAHVRPPRSRLPERL